MPSFRDCGLTVTTSILIFFTISTHAYLTPGYGLPNYDLQQLHGGYGPVGVPIIHNPSAATSPAAGGDETYYGDSPFYDFLEDEPKKPKDKQEPETEKQSADESDENNESNTSEEQLSAETPIQMPFGLDTSEENEQNDGAANAEEQEGPQHGEPDSTQAAEEEARSKESDDQHHDEADAAEAEGDDKAAAENDFIFGHGLGGMETMGLGSMGLSGVTHHRMHVSKVKTLPVHGPYPFERGPLGRLDRMPIEPYDEPYPGWMMAASNPTVQAVNRGNSLALTGGTHAGAQSTVVQTASGAHVIQGEASHGGAAHLISGGAHLVGGGAHLVGGGAHLVGGGAHLVGGGTHLVSGGTHLVTGHVAGTTGIHGTHVGSDAHLVKTSTGGTVAVHTGGGGVVHRGSTHLGESVGVAQQHHVGFLHKPVATQVTTASGHTIVGEEPKTVAGVAGHTPIGVVAHIHRPAPAELHYPPTVSNAITLRPAVSSVPALTGGLATGGLGGAVGIGSGMHYGVQGGLSYGAGYGMPLGHMYRGRKYRLLFHNGRLSILSDGADHMHHGHGYGLGGGLGMGAGLSMGGGLGMGAGLSHSNNPLSYSHGVQGDSSHGLNYGLTYGHGTGLAHGVNYGHTMTVPTTVDHTVTYTKPVGQTLTYHHGVGHAIGHTYSHGSLLGKK